MHLSKLLAPDIQKALESEPDTLAEALEELHGEDLAEVVAELPPELVAQLLDVLPIEKTADVLGRLPDELSRATLESVGAERAAAWLTEMAADDRVDLVQEVTSELREAIIEQIAEREPEVAEETRALTAFGEDTAGGIMTTDYLALSPDLTVEQATDEVRRMSREADVEMIYYIYVVTYDRLVGVLSLRDLITSEATTPISEVMTDNVVKVSPLDDQEEVALAMARYDLSAIPVVDDQGHMMGVVTIDDVVDVMVEEATEDAHKLGAMVPIEESYVQTGFLEFVRSRVTWLVVLFVGELLTASVMNHYETDVAAVMDLVIFVPLIISSGGNSGSQSSSLIIRALALGELSPSDWPKVFMRELGIGIALGGLLGVIGFARVLVSDRTGDQMLAMASTVSLSVVAVVTLGTLVGSLMPLMIKRMGLDPAVSSTPFVASLVDVFGLVVYFTVARLIFGLVLP